jgi:hypothetical protein
MFTNGESHKAKFLFINYCTSIGIDLALSTGTGAALEQQRKHKS